VVAGIVALTGCGGQSTTTTAVPVSPGTVEQTAPIAAKVRRVVLHETDFRIAPARVDAGHEGLVSIRFFNDGKVPHALAVHGPNGLVEFDGQVDPGHRGILQVDLDRMGTYTMYCPLDGHRAKGMVATISVRGTAPAQGVEPSGGSTVPTTTTTTPTQTHTTTQTNTTTQTKTVTRTQTTTTPTQSQTTTTGSGGY
jgi:hypothetical protein